MASPQKREKLTTEQYATLEAEFQRNRKPPCSRYAELAVKFGVRTERVSTWFHNRRGKERRRLQLEQQGQDVDFSLLSSGSETSPEFSSPRELAPSKLNKAGEIIGSTFSDFRRAPSSRQDALGSPSSLSPQYSPFATPQSTLSTAGRSNIVFPPSPAMSSSSPSGMKRSLSIMSTANRFVELSLEDTARSSPHQKAARNTPLQKGRGPSRRNAVATIAEDEEDGHADNEEEEAEEPSPKKPKVSRKPEVPAASLYTFEKAPSGSRPHYLPPKLPNAATSSAAAHGQSHFASPRHSASSTSPMVQSATLPSFRSKPPATRLAAPAPAPSGRIALASPSLASPFSMQRSSGFLPTSPGIMVPHSIPTQPIPPPILRPEVEAELQRLIENADLDDIVAMLDDLSIRRPDLINDMALILTARVPEDCSIEDEIDRFRRNVFRALPYAVGGSNSDAEAYEASKRRMEVFQAACLGFSTSFVRKEMWNDAVELMLIISDHVIGLPDFDIPEHNQIKNSLAEYCSRTLNEVVARATFAADLWPLVMKKLQDITLRSRGKITVRGIAPPQVAPQPRAPEVATRASSQASVGVYPYAPHVSAYSPVPINFMNAGPPSGSAPTGGKTPSPDDGLGNNRQAA